MKHFILATMFILVFACSTNIYSQTSKKTTSTTKTATSIKKSSNQKKVEVVIEEKEEKLIEVAFSNPNKKIGYFNHLGKIAYSVSRETITNYFLSSINIDKKMYEIKNISIQKISNSDLYELVIAGVNSISYNGFAISFPIEHYENNFYLSAYNNEIMIRGGIGSGCQQVKLSNNDCGCNDSDWLGEGNIGDVKYFSFKTFNPKFEIKPLNFYFDYAKFCNFINANQS